MKTIALLLQEKFLKAALDAFPSLSQNKDLPIEVSQSTQEKFGHYQFNSAMKLSKTLQKNPREIAQQILDHLEKAQLIAKVEIAGPGFVNITIDSHYIAACIEKNIADPWLGIDHLPANKKVVIDFSSPNIAKEMHVGHLRSTIIGECLARLFEFLGYRVLRLNHIGDWGTAFGMLIAHIKNEAPDVLTGKQSTDLTHLVQWYKASKQRFDNDPEFKKASQMEVVALQGGDPDALKAWKVICEISEKAYQEIYSLLDVELISRGESFYNPMLNSVVKDLEAKGLIQISDGAKCIFVEGFKNRDGDPLPLIVQKSDGGYNYGTTDMAAIRHRIEEEKADRLIYVVDAGQSTHFQMVFKIAEMAGYLDRSKVQVDHVPFGLVLGADGKKFRTRSGETERLIDLLQNGIDQARAILLERSPEMDPKDREKLAKALGIGAIKYADLSSHRTSDYTFSYERMLRFEGNTAAFLMYSYVRVAGIKRKVNSDIGALIGKEKIILEHPSEIALGIHLMQFGEALEQVACDLLPNRLTDYLYGLAEKFNAFFRDCRVEGSPQQNSRLLLCEAVARTMHAGLHILGVQPVERM